MIICTDFGHDPDDAITLAYLIENRYPIHTIILTPGHIQQQESLCGFLYSYYKDPNLNFNIHSLNENITHIQTKLQIYDEKFTTGSHRIFDQNILENSELLEDYDVLDYHQTSLIIGPPLGLGDKLKCKYMFFQGGYSPNSIKPLDKFNGRSSVSSYNPNGAKKDFNKLLESKNIEYKYFIGKNVCHGFLKKDLEKLWVPSNKKVQEFWRKLSPNKAMHDVLAAIMMTKPSLGVWEKAKPVWRGSELSTEYTTDNFYTLIGTNL